MGLTRSMVLERLVRHFDGVTDAPRQVCERCRSEWPTGATACTQCGGGLRPLSPLTVHCGFCERANPRHTTAQCIGCGGPLPSLPGGYAGPQPPDPPRALPPVVAPTQRAAENKGRVGLIFTILGGAMTLSVVGAVLGVVFLAVGIGFLLRPRLQHKRKIAALTHGHATRGEIVSVNANAEDGGGRPWFEIRYAFQTPSGSHAGTCFGYDPSHTHRRPGDATWVVYAAQREKLSAIWPPVR